MLQGQVDLLLKFLDLLSLCQPRPICKWQRGLLLAQLLYSCLRHNAKKNFLPSVFSKQVNECNFSICKLWHFCHLWSYIFCTLVQKNTLLFYCHAFSCKLCNQLSRNHELTSWTMYYENVCNKQRHQSDIYTCTEMQKTRKLTRWQQHCSTEQCHLLVWQLQTAESFSQVKHGADQVVTTCRNARGQLTNWKVNDEVNSCCWAGLRHLCLHHLASIQNN